MIETKGVFSVLPTPFHEDGSLDLESLRRVIDLFIAGGVNGFTALGVTGEIARLALMAGVSVSPPLDLLQAIRRCETSRRRSSCVNGAAHGHVLSGLKALQG